jgi:pilus assembly protein Flp/PilA
MEKFIAGVKRFWREEEGSEVVEWALVAGLIVAVGATVMVAIGTGAETHLQELSTLLNTP